MSCPNEISICIVRGDFFPLYVQLGKEWVEVAENPAQYRCRLVFREFQDDTSPDLISLVATPEAVGAAIGNEPRVAINFGLIGSLTATLPDYPVSGFCEIYLATAPGNPTRLFNMKVATSD